MRLTQFSPLLYYYTYYSQDTSNMSDPEESVGMCGVRIIATVADTGYLCGYKLRNALGLPVCHNFREGHILIVDDASKYRQVFKVFSDNPPYHFITRHSCIEDLEDPSFAMQEIVCDNEGRVLVCFRKYNNSVFARTDNPIGHKIVILSPTWEYEGVIKSDECGAACHIVGVDSENSIYISDSINNLIHVFDRRGEFQRQFAITVDKPGQFAISGQRLYIVEHDTSMSRQLHILSLSNGDVIDSVPLPGVLSCRHESSRLTACQDGRLLITGAGLLKDPNERRFIVAGYNLNRPPYQGKDRYTYMYVIDKDGTLVVEQCFRMKADATIISVLNPNTLLMYCTFDEWEDREDEVDDGYYYPVHIRENIETVSLPGLHPPLIPMECVKVCPLKHLCFYQIRHSVKEVEDFGRLGLPQAFIDTLTSYAALDKEFRYDIDDNDTGHNDTDDNDTDYYDRPTEDYDFHSDVSY